MASKPAEIFITMGDVHGIGPEVSLKALQQLFPAENVSFVLVGSRRVLEFYRELLQVDLPIADEGDVSPGHIRFLDLPDVNTGPFRPGQGNRKTGAASVAFIHAALEQMQNRKRAALVTAPIAKEAIWRAGHLFPGQTELLADWFGVKRFAMLLVSGGFRVGFVTTHIPLKEVPGALSQSLVVEKVLTVREDLRRRFKVKKPKIALAALNPHAGEKGMLGREEIEILIPAVQALRERQITMDGPFSADTLFTRDKLDRYDAFIALYHDQGMIPVKMHAFGKAVNYTAGLPVVRTSPDHGTAFDIAGKGVADESSMVEAIRLAIELVH